MAPFYLLFDQQHPSRCWLLASLSKFSASFRGSTDTADTKCGVQSCPEGGSLFVLKGIWGSAVAKGEELRCSGCPLTSGSGRERPSPSESSKSSCRTGRWFCSGGLEFRMVGIRWGSHCVNLCSRFTGTGRHRLISPA